MTHHVVRPLVSFAALLCLCLVPATSAAQVPRFDCLYVFGDSLADTGNVLIQTTALGMNPAVPPSVTPHRMYFDGRFSNGYVGVEYLWERLTGHRPGSAGGLKAFLESPFSQNGCALNLAFGGTGTPYVDRTPGGFLSPGLLGQVELFRFSHYQRSSGRALYVVSSGANDYRDDPFNVPMEPADVVRNIESAIVRLYQLGARDVIVVDLPDLGLIPANAGDASASAISREHNERLHRVLARLKARYPRLHLIPVKLDLLFAQLRETMNATVPMIEVFSQTTPGMSACLFIDPASCIDMPPFVFNAEFGFLFWDVVHPTTEAHRNLGEYMLQRLAREYD